MDTTKLSTARAFEKNSRGLFETNSRALPKIIVIVGPTASGKTALAIKIALRLGSGQAQKLYGIKGAEIISADSRQIYRGMDLGTAKPRSRTFDSLRGRPPHNSPKSYKLKAKSYYSEGIIHHLIDIKNPNQPYTVAQYKKDAIRVIKKILKKGKLPILVGGTGLYVKAVVDNLEIPEVKPNPQLRKKLEKELESKGLPHLYGKLIKLDPEAAYIVDRNNPRRVIRALEIMLETNKPFSAQRKAGKKLFNALKIGINPGKEKLKNKIEKRVDQMIEDGLVDEVKSLTSKYPPKFGKNSRGSIRDGFEKQYLSAFDAIGYREIIDYLKDADKYGLKRINTDIRMNQFHPHKSASLEEAIAQIKKNTWHYAKRQMTWFKKDKEIKWVKSNGEAWKPLREFLMLNGQHQRISAWDGQGRSLRKLPFPTSTTLPPCWIYMKERDFWSSDRTVR